MNEIDQNSSILTLNAGSSSLKFSLFTSCINLNLLVSGEIENLGTSNTEFHFINHNSGQKCAISLGVQSIKSIPDLFLEWIGKKEEFRNMAAIGHRIVYGINYTHPEMVTGDFLKEIKTKILFDPDHLPLEIALMEVFLIHYSGCKQWACFDTVFHLGMPKVAKLLPIPRKYFEKGIYRYGFHGLSYTYLLGELKKQEGGDVSNGKIIMAHLGGGCSLVAVDKGKSLDTTMGFSPSSGLPMGTRSGDLDGGLVSYLLKQEKLSINEFSEMMNHQSGLLGISEISSDMRELMNLEDQDERAEEAIAYFCYQTRKWIASYTGVLEGLDTLVFSGGIGQNSPEARSRICDGLAYLGIKIHEINNMNNERIISDTTSRVQVLVIKTNEELVIAQIVYQNLNFNLS